MTVGGAPVYVWPGGGITLMVDVMRVPDNAFGYVPTPALVAPIEFTLRRDDYVALGGHAQEIRSVEDVIAEGRRVLQPAPRGAGIRRQPLAAARATAPPGGQRPMSGPQIAMLPDGRRLHLNHGPIDLIVEAFGEAAEVRAAYGQATARFRTILGELVEELPALRSAASSRRRVFRGATAQRMEAAVSPLAGEHFITPMAAVAGSVADEILGAMVAGRALEKAYVNNGGDSALYLAPGQSMRLAIAGTGNGSATAS